MTHLINELENIIMINDLITNTFIIGVEKKKKEWHQVFISEYDMPDDFICVYKQNYTNSLHKTQTKKVVEKLFTL